ncbi:MAG: T9SS type A sorting domain-containing protein [Flavobacterium sp.]|nr:T9SS type A sorting domain-containing protein [Flavobacterium sp.]
MKKITLLFALVVLSFSSNAQVLLTEGFDTALTWSTARIAGTSTTTGWTRQTVGTAPSCNPFVGNGMARFYSYNIAAGNAYRLTSPSINFAGANYRIKFHMYRDGGYPTDADDIKVYHHTTLGTPTTGSLLGTVNRSMALAPVVNAEGWYAYSFDLPAGTTGAGFMSFVATSQYGNNIFIDNVSIVQIQADDAEMSTFDLADISASTGNTPISGSFKNAGLNTINNIDLNWQADGGAVNTQTLSGINLAPGQVYNYTHQTPWNATLGLHSISVWVTAAGDSDATNNQLTKSISVASNSTSRTPLYEKFSSSTCPPCATFNGTYFSPFYGPNSGSFNLISYQVNWPGAGDPYYTTEVGTRVGYYGVSGAPTLFVDAKDGTNFNTAALQADLNDAIAQPAYFAVTATKSELGFSEDLTVNVNVTPYVTGTYKVHVAVVEKITTGNVATNGETSFKNVMMKMLPNAAGTTINCTYDQPVPTITLQQNLAGLFIEDMTDLEVIVFIQSTNSGKAIMQSTKATELLSNDQFAAKKFKVYPNPSEGIVRIKSETPVSVSIADITGKVVFTMNDVTSDTQLNLSSLQKGMYMATITSGSDKETQKIILK